MQIGTASRLRPGSIERSSRSEGTIDSEFGIITTTELRTIICEYSPMDLRYLASNQEIVGSTIGIPSGESHYSLYFFEN